MNSLKPFGSHLSRLIASKGFLMALFAGVLLVRLGWTLSHTDEHFRDTDAYLEVAGNLAREGVFAVGQGDVSPTASRPPLYPMLLSLVADSEGHIPAFRVALVNYGLGMLTILFTGLFVWRAVPRSPAAAVISALLVAFDPLLIAFSPQAMTETLAACVVALSCWIFALAMRSTRLWPALILGVVVGLASLSRSSFLLLVPVAVIGLGWQKLGAEGNWMVRLRPSLMAMVICLLGAISTLVPWIIRNYGVFGKFIPATTHGGYTLAVANSPDYLNYVRVQGRDSGPWSLSQFDETISSDYPCLSYYQPGVKAPNILPQLELEMDRFLYQLAFEWITADLEAFYFLTADRFLQFWNPTPHRSGMTESSGQKLFRWGVGAWYSVVLGMMLLSTFLSGKKIFQAPLVWPLLICLVITAIHLFYWSNMRMRAPVMPCVAVFASMGILSVWSFVCERLRKGVTHPRILVAEGLQCGDL
jgi:4-amino-4-deoxy-L-arabinose transferase-like glycosyltransferase